MYTHLGRFGLWSISVLALVVGLALALAPAPIAALQTSPEQQSGQSTEQPPADQSASDVDALDEDADHHTDGQHDEPSAGPNPDGEHDTGDDSEHGGSDDHAGGSDRLTCADINPTWSEISLMGHPLSGHYVRSDAVRTVEFFVFDGPAGGKLVNWHADGDIDAVILRSGLDAAVYEYEPPAIQGSGLRPPLVDREGRNLAAVLACYQADVIEVGIDLFLADSSDPVVVGDEFSYLIDITTSDPLADSEVVLDVAAELSVVDAPDCAVDGRTVRCSPPLDEHTEWTIEVRVNASVAGVAVSSARLDADGAGEPVTATALEVTRIIGPPGSGGGCGGHDDGHEPSESPDHGEDDGCSGGGQGLMAACEAIDPASKTIVLQGPFATRRYLLVGDAGERIWVTVDETTGSQMVTWESDTPIDAALARTGTTIVTYRYEPPALAGSGVVGPVSGSGPRPIADVAFCIVDRPSVDVSLSAVSVPQIEAAGTRPVRLSVENTGFEPAVIVEVGIEPNELVALTGCGQGRMIDDRCVFEGVGAESSLPIDISLRGRAVGHDDVVLHVVAANEPSEQRNNNTLTVAIVVVPRTTALDQGGSDPTPPTISTSTTSPPVVLSVQVESETDQPVEGPGTVVEAATLPFTGGGALSWLALLGAGLTSVGAALVSLAATTSGPLGARRSRHRNAT